MRFAKYLLIPALLLTILAPLTTVAAAGPADGAPATINAELMSLEQDDEGHDDAGTGVALGIVSLVLLLVAIVAVIGAAALGIIGLGYWQSTSSD